MNFLTNDQKRKICMIARAAYDHWEGRTEFEATNFDISKTARFEAWRRYEQGKAVGRQSLSDCVSELHYLPLLAHFAAIAGEGAVALRALLRHAEEGRIQVYFKLREALAERGLEEGYASAICSRQFKCALGDASEKQLWNLFFTVRNRRPLAPKAERSPAPRYVRSRLSTLSAEAPKLAPALVPISQDPF